MQVTSGREHRYEHHDWWEKFWKDEEGNVVIYQRPNIWLIIWVVLTLCSLFVPYGMPETVFWWGSLAALTVWCGLEVFRGVNYFRRLLGVFVFLLVLIAAFKLA